MKETYSVLNSPSRSIHSQKQRKLKMVNTIPGIFKYFPRIDPDKLKEFATYEKEVSIKKLRDLREITNHSLHEIYYTLNLLYKNNL